MRRFGVLVFIFGLAQLCLAVVPNELIDLTPLPREVWDAAHVLAKRQDNYDSAIGLKKKEQLMWTSSNKPDQKQTVVSVVVGARQDENIIDMDRFSFLLQSVTCTDTAIAVKFKNHLAYFAAKIAWNWVNFNDLRQFVLVTRWPGCGTVAGLTGSPTPQPDPWVVRKAVFVDKTATVNLEAKKSTWAKVANTTVIDFGDFIIPSKIGGRSLEEAREAHENELTERDISASLEGAFSINLASTFPERIIAWNFTSKRAKGKMEVNCADCGTTGELTFAGHIEASLFGGIEVFEISARPIGVGVNFGLEVLFEGHLNFKRNGLNPAADKFKLLQLPLPSGWRIPKVLTFGPNIQINAGYQIDYIGGSASLTTGLSATIPDTSIAKVDLQSESPLEVSGWIPKVEVQPLEVQAQIDVEAKVYTEIAVAVTLEVLDENGVNVGVGLRLPEVRVEVAAGYNEIDGEGFCPNSQNSYGLTIDASIGASLVLEGYTEVNGNKNIFLTVPLYESDSLHDFDQLCIGFEAYDENFCYSDRQEGDADWGYKGPEDEAPILRREYVAKDPYSRRSELELRSLTKRRDKSGDYYSLSCDPKKKDTPSKLPIRPQVYPRPSVVTPNVIETMVPGIFCTDRRCDHESLTIEDDRTPGWMVLYNWNTEHIYEGNWLAAFLSEMQERLFKDDCNGMIDYLNSTNEATRPVINTPDLLISNNGQTHETPRAYIKALYQNLGTEFTYHKTMALLPGKQNRMKYRMFQEQEMDKKFRDPWRKDVTDKNTGNVLFCQLGRMVQTCKYMDTPSIREKLSNTIKALNGVFSVMDKTSTVEEGWVEAHRAWFEPFHKKGFKHIRKHIRENAKWLQGQEKYEELDDEQQKVVDSLALVQDDDDESKWCSNHYEYPAAP